MQAGSTMSMETPVKSPGSTADGGGFVKKLKEFDGLAISIGNGNSDGTETGTDRRLSDRFVEIQRIQQYALNYLVF